MPKRPEPARARENTLLFALFALFLFASPFTAWWASEGSHWLLPYLFWLLIILIGAWLTSKPDRHDL
jgi:hypothetical protein